MPKFGSMFKNRHDFMTLQKGNDILIVTVFIQSKQNFKMQIFHILLKTYKIISDLLNFFQVLISRRESTIQLFYKSFIVFLGVFFLFTCPIFMAENWRHLRYIQ